MPTDRPDRQRAAVLYGGKDIRVETLPVPRPGPGEVLVRVRAAGICGSDVLAYRGQGPWQHSATSPGQDGHELAGEIAAMGPGVTGLAVGDRVGVEPLHLLACGQCRFCRSDRAHLCQQRGLRNGVHVTSHGFSEYDTCPASRAHRLPDNVSIDAAAILDCYACAVHTLNLVDIPAGATVVVLGSGTMGLTTGQVARARGLRVLLTGTNRQVLRLALDSGAADEVALVGTDDPAAMVATLTGGAGADVVVDAIAIPAVTMQQAAELVAPGGTIVVLGVFTSAPLLDPHLAYVREVSIRWSNSYDSFRGRSEYDLALELLASGLIDADRLITHRFGLADIGAAFVAADDKDSSHAMKVLVIP
jgi:2-desacetyl-2-hydroxyethyl bacteriochlorophyllide A dehydrogenase